MNKNTAIPKLLRAHKNSGRNSWHVQVRTAYLEHRLHNYSMAEAHGLQYADTFPASRCFTQSNSLAANLQTVQLQIALSNLGYRQELIDTADELSLLDYAMLIMAVYEVYARACYCPHALRAYRAAEAIVGTIKNAAWERSA
jgi:hypothetical protein